jgi:hypothetical protein
LQQSRLTAKWMQFGGGGALISRAALVRENPVVTTLIALRGATRGENGSKLGSQTAKTHKLNLSFCDAQNRKGSRTRFCRMLLSDS